MRTLTIEYLLEGKRRGYTLTSPTDGLDAEIVKTIWRNAMPRGKKWADAAYENAHSLKSFALENGQFALCEVNSTDQVDEVGRRGIRRAEIHLLNVGEYADYLAHKLASLPPQVVAEAERKLHSRDWELLFKKHRDSQHPRTLMKPQTILAYDYAPSAPNGWQFVEACVLLLVTRKTILTNLIEITPKINPFADKALSFTTLALDPHEEGRIVAIPYTEAAAQGNLSFIDIR